MCSEEFNKVLRPLGLHANMTGEIRPMTGEIVTGRERMIHQFTVWVPDDFVAPPLAERDAE